MAWNGYWAAVLSNAFRVTAGALSVAAGLEIVHPAQAVAPLSPYATSLSPDPEVADLLPAQTLTELYQVRDRLEDKIKQSPPRPELFLVGIAQQQRLETLQTVSARIQLEEIAQANWQNALRLALQAEKMERLPRRSAATWKQAQANWRQALNSLNLVSADSFLAGRKTEAIKAYRARLATAVHQATLAESAYLRAIARRSNLSAQAMITVCHSSGVCHHLRGNQPPNSPASLAKVPLAMALLQKADAEDISLDTPIYVEPGNFTEDASDIQTGRRYPLRIVLTQMIDHSSNIAANQLIDYLGQSYINQILQNRGYKVTRVNHKFMGEATMPANPGQGKNRLTSNELTNMMLQIYQHKYPGSAALRQALKQQDDRVLGFAALQGSAAEWLGEKTGQNSQVLGTTLALKISGKYYFITVIDNRGNALTIRRCIAQIADHLEQTQ